MRADLIEIIAREITGRPDAHMSSIELLRSERDGFDGVRVLLVDAPSCLSGKRTGLPNWRKASNKQPRLISGGELDAAAAAWSQRTGGCIRCAATGQEFVRWSVTDGTTYRACPGCNGTGGK